MAGATWRDSAARHIARVIQEVGTDDPAALRKALREAYPYGERKYWPYKVWCSEVRRQLIGTPARSKADPPGPDGPLMDLMQEA